MLATTRENVAIDEHELANTLISESLGNTSIRFTHMRIIIHTHLVLRAHMCTESITEVSAQKPVHFLL